MHHRVMGQTFGIVDIFTASNPVIGGLMGLSEEFELVSVSLDAPKPMPNKAGATQQEWRCG